MNFTIPLNSICGSFSFGFTEHQVLNTVTTTTTRRVRINKLTDQYCDDNDDVDSDDAHKPSHS